MAQKKSRAKTEYGDFQTPLQLAVRACAKISQLDIAPYSIIEPTCGVGNFLVASLNMFQTAKYLFGIDINSNYIDSAQYAVDNARRNNQSIKIQVTNADFFSYEWESLLSVLPDPLLFIGNPPWVTNSELSTLESTNIPVKRNSKQITGIEAITGASNFDISEWMLLRMTKLLAKRRGAMAMFCKTSVARKILLNEWQSNSLHAASRIYKIDTLKEFDVAVDACLFIYDNTKVDKSQSCYVYNSLDSSVPDRYIGLRDSTVVSDLHTFDQWSHLLAKSNDKSSYQWRSGIKHDASAIMELQKVDEDRYKNRLGDVWTLNSEYVYPMLKSSDLANGSHQTPRRWMLVTQQNIGDETASIKIAGPETWQYLEIHSQILDSRKSTIYRNRPRFSIFGIGDYAFAPWKIAISGMYKHLNFRVVGSYYGKPIVLDDTCYFLACSTQAEANLIADMLNSRTAKEFLQSFIFWDDKRPITARLLKKLNLTFLARELGLFDEFIALSGENNRSKDYVQLRLLERKLQYRLQADRNSDDS